MKLYSHTEKCDIGCKYTGSMKQAYEVHRKFRHDFDWLNTNGEADSC